MCVCVCVCVFCFLIFKNFLFIYGHASTCGILVPNQELNPHPLLWKPRVLTTGPPEKSHVLLFWREGVCPMLVHHCALKAHTLCGFQGS